MPKYDAFGREIGEDTLGGLGGDEATVHATPSPQAVPTAAPDRERAAPAPQQFTIPEAPPRPVPVRRTRGLGCLVGLVILAAVVAGPVVALVSFVDTAGDAIEDATGVFDGLPGVEPPETPARPPTGIAGRSMIAPDNLARALRRLKGDGARAAVQVTVWPERLTASGIVTGRRQRDIQITSDGTVQRGDARRVNSALKTVPLGDLDPRSPARLVRAAAKQFRVRPQRINYVIASHDPFTGGGGHRWVAYFKNGVIVAGDERGSVVRRID